MIHSLVVVYLPLMAQFVTFGTVNFLLCGTRRTFQVIKSRYDTDNMCMHTLATTARGPAKSRSSLLFIDLRAECAVTVLKMSIRLPPRISQRKGPASLWAVQALCEGKQGLWRTHCPWRLEESNLDTNTHTCVRAHTQTHTFTQTNTKKKKNPPKKKIMKLRLAWTIP